MYSNKNSLLLICIIISIVLLWCTVKSSDVDSSEQQDHSVDVSDEDSDDIADFYRRASLRPVVVHQRGSLRPFGKRASLRPPGKRASLRPPGKRASLRPPGKRASLRPPGKRVPLRPVIYSDKRKR